MIIAQISDMHCTSAPQFLRDKLTMAINEINRLNPDLVIIAGDITENGFKTEFEEAKRFIDQIECSQKIVTMGNHDSMYTGYMLFEEFFGPSSGILEIEKCRVVYVNTARPDKDEGRVGRDQIQFIKDSFAEDKLNILVMHHHLIPVPDTGLELAIVEDAGDVLKLLSKVNPDLVLSGHRHRPWSWKLNGINFLFSGAVSTIRLRGFFENSYNVIKIRDGRIKSKLKIVGGSLLDFDKLT
ncbi:MAG: cyclic 3',5'-adenosine monophosphate phosphodiesterase [Candidatus Bathyarchaeota archaeon BA1]|nr:MAG: cyclic 3',5'-adenosine monophosphate phosphodiesterase [Candidatus Bathyarchaeota archaeon BA1]